MRYQILTLAALALTGCITTKEPVSQTHSRKMELAIKQIQKCEFDKAKKIIGSISENTIRYKQPGRVNGCEWSEFSSYPKNSMFRLLSLTERAVDKASAECEKIPGKETEQGFKEYERCMNDKNESLDIPYEEFTKGNLSEYDQDKERKYREVKPENLPFCRPADYITICFAKNYALVQNKYEQNQVKEYKKKESAMYADTAHRIICGLNSQVAHLRKTREESAALLKKQMSASAGSYDKNKLEATLLIHRQKMNGEIAGINRERKAQMKVYREETGKPWSDSNCE